jgi:hypothetical protein
MIDEAQGRIDYDECGSGPAVVLLPGSCSTGTAMAARHRRVGNRFRNVTVCSVMVEPATGAPQAIPPIHATPKQWSRLEEMSVPGH